MKMNYRLLQDIGNVNEQIFYRDEYKNYSLSSCVESLIFSNSFIEEFNKPEKSEFVKRFINTVFKEYWFKCWTSLTLCDKPCGLSQKRAELIIKYVEYCFNCKNSFRLENTKIEREYKRETNGSKSISKWNGERFVDVCASI